MYPFLWHSSLIPLILLAICIFLAFFYLFSFICSRWTSSNILYDILDRIIDAARRRVISAVHKWHKVWFINFLTNSLEGDRFGVAYIGLVANLFLFAEKFDSRFTPYFQSDEVSHAYFSIQHRFVDDFLMFSFNFFVYFTKILRTFVCTFCIEKICQWYVPNTYCYIVIYMFMQHHNDTIITTQWQRQTQEE